MSESKLNKIFPSINCYYTADNKDTDTFVTHFVTSARWIGRLSVHLQLNDNNEQHDRDSK